MPPPRRRRAPARKPRRKAPAKKKAGRSARRPARRTARTNQVRVIQSYSGNQSSSLYKGPSRPLRLKRNQSMLGSKNVYVVNIPHELDVSPGTQMYVNVGQWFSLHDINEISKRVPYPGGGISPVGHLPVEFHLHSVQANIDIVNSSGCSAIVDIYDVVAKKDIPNRSASGGVDTRDVQSPTAAWQSGMQNQDISANSGIFPTFQVGSLPNDSQLFNDYYKIVSKKTVLMAQNGQHCHKVSMAPNLTMNQNLIDTQSQYLQNLRGIGGWTFVVARGQVINDNEYSVSTTAPITLRFVSTERYIYSFLQTTGKTYFAENNLTRPLPMYTQYVSLNNPTSDTVLNV